MPSNTYPSTFSPRRAAPAPPNQSKPYDELPADHPFLNPYVPLNPTRQAHNHFHRSSSSSTLASDFTIRTPPISPARQPRSSRAHTASPTAVNGPFNSSTSSPASSWFTAPLSSSHRDSLGHLHIPRPEPCEPPTMSAFSPSPRSQPFVALPTELAVFDSRSRTNLLQDIEYITGRKLSLPFLARRKARKEVKEKDDAVIKDGLKPSTERLIKDRRKSEEQELLEEAVLIDVSEKQSSRRGRGVREGNWI